MTNEQIIAALTATARPALHLDDESYIDWSTVNADGTRTFEVCNAGGKTVWLTLDHDEMTTLLQRLAATLLADGE